MRQVVVGLLSITILMSSACTTNKATQGALGGSALGAGLGAIVGNSAGNTGAGIAIGAASGAIGGALIGNGLDSQDSERQRVEEEQIRKQQ